MWFWSVGYVASFATAILLGRFGYGREKVASIFGAVCFAVICILATTMRHRLAPAGQWDRVP